MIRLFGVVFVILLFGVAPVLTADYFSQSGFLDKFFIEQSMTILGTVLAIYIAAASSFLIILMDHEKKRGQVIFGNATKEVKHSILFIIGVFVVHFLLLVATPKGVAPQSCLDLILKGGKSFSFFLYIYALYELSHAMFGIRESLNAKGTEA